MILWFYDSMIGTVRNEKYTGGVYIWTHILSSSMYIGSSKHLSRRLIGHFKGTHLPVGKLIPLSNKEGLGAFTL